jgi:LmbE family N-acetylglucosaminyl deacetylase
MLCCDHVDEDDAMRSEGTGPLGRVMVISPHLDDAVFSCGELLSAHPHATVATIFAGTPPAGHTTTDWDRACGFRSACEAMVARRNEDASALLTLGARPVWLNFLDSQYCDGSAGATAPQADDIAESIALLITREQPDAVLFPLGLFHSDHDLAHRACLAAWQARSSQVLPGQPSPRWLAYEDALYRRMDGLREQRLAGMNESGVRASVYPVTWQGDRAAKAAAVACYASQLKAFGPGGYDDTADPEGYWSLDRAGLLHAAA